MYPVYFVYYVTGLYLNPTQTEGSKAKDFCFELNLAAHLEAIGCDIVELTDPDIIFIYAGEKFSIAAKHLYDERFLLKTYEKACKQIDKVYNSSQYKDCKGIVAVSIESLTNINEMMYLQNEKKLSNLLSTSVEKFIKDNEKLLYFDKYKNRNVLGLIVHVATIGFLKDEGLPTFGQFMGISCDINNSYWPILRKLSEDLAKYMGQEK